MPRETTVGDHPVASVVIPAHNEEASIADTLSSLLVDAAEGEFEVVVVCNGCTDSTADLARCSPGVGVVELVEPSKIAALREGDRQTDVFPRIYLDGDVLLTTYAARALASALEGGDTLVAGVRGAYRLDGCSTGVRLFYEFRQRLPVFAEGIIGAGVYAMSREGRARFAEWPDILGDDQFVYRLFRSDERVCVPDHRTIVEPMPDLRTVVRRGARVRVGNDQLSRGVPGQAVLPPPAAGVREAVRSSLMSVRGSASIIVFMLVTMAIRLQARWMRSRTWS